MQDKNNKVDYKTLNELIKIGNILLKIMLALFILSICVVTIYLLDKTNVISTIGKILEIISPLFIGLGIAWLLEPAINYFVKNKVGRKLSAVVVYLIFIFLIVIILALIVPEFISQVNELIKKIPDFLKQISEFINNIFLNFSNSEYDLTAVKDSILNSLNKWASGITAKDLTGIVNGVGSSLKVIFKFLLSLLIGFYLSLDFRKVSKFFNNLVPDKYKAEVNKVKKSLNDMLRSYVNGTLLSCLFVMIFSLIGFLISGVSSPLLFAIFCAITNIIPYFGPYIGGIPVVVVGFASSPFTGIGCLITVIVVQFLEGNILHPIIVGKAISLHPITITISLLIFEYFFGVVGMIFAPPIVATLKILWQYLEDKFHLVNRLKATIN